MRLCTAVCVCGAGCVLCRSSAQGVGRWLLHLGWVSATMASTFVMKPPGEGGTAGFLVPLGQRLQEPCAVPGT
jgi:hypothetical protein